MSLQINNEGNRLHISFKWRRPIAYFLIFFCAFWDGFMIFWYGIAISQQIWIMALFGIIHLGVGVGLTYYTISLLINKTDVWVDSREIVIKHGPLRAFKAGLSQVNARDIEQLYVKEEISQGKNGTSRSYALRGKFAGGEDKVILSQYVVHDANMAVRLEEEIEKFLGITDYQVRGEYGASQKLDSAMTAMARPRNLKRPSNPTDLGLKDLATGYILTYQAKNWEVVYETQYDWDGEESDRQLQLSGETGSHLLLYLKVDMAVITPYTEKRLETHEMRGEQFQIKKEGDDIVEINFQGDSYKLSSMHTGRVFAGGKAHQGKEGKQWFYKSVDGQRHLRLLQLGGSSLQAYAGSLRREYDFSGILPAAD